jgi:signal transduction histidine kinase
MTSARAIPWPAQAGLGLVRALVLVTVSLLYPAVWTSLAWLIWFAAVSWPQPNVLQVAGVLICLLVPTDPICGVLRLLVRRWTGITLVSGVRPATPVVRMSTGYWWNGSTYSRFRSQARVRQWIRPRLRHLAAWRDRRALALAPFSVGVVAALPLAGIAAAGAIFAQIASPVRVIGIVPLVVGVGIAPYAWRWTVAILVWLLRPSSTMVLSARVNELTAQRADATAVQAAEIRRIERDLHDGAQARLAALGLTLVTANRMLDRDPEQTRTLLAESVESTSAALRELRELVRGINPPVLSERGLVDAIRALALDSPLTVAVQTDPAFPTQLDVPIESALYFGVSELLTNAIKHAHTNRMDIRLSQNRRGIMVEVNDYGIGGARIPADGGLAGLQRRLAVFDGTLSIDSPPGGPTHARMTVPWTSS